ncbi:MAG: hypothetical protein J0H88_22205 [Sphingomonadales bacterium]|nr:hypothetical protein [Sphingomonadales bacterium]
MTALSNLISAAVAARMTPEFIEKEVDARVDKLIVESVDRALRSYSDTGKLIEKAVEDALRVNSIDLPAYGEIVAAMLKAQIERRVAPLVAERLAADYIIDHDAEGRQMTKTAQVAKCGNSVCPPLAEALVRANMVAEIGEREPVAA